jgi:hypothetical protein
LYNPNAIANIILLANLINCSTVVFNSDVDHAFHVTTSNCKMKFVKSKLGLFYHDICWSQPSPKKTTQFNLINTIADNKKAFTTRQIGKADLVKDVYELVGRLSHKDFICMIKYNLTKNCPVSLDDVNNVLHIYGPDIAAIKGKTIQQ